jgi:hypothetical protein
VNVNVTTSVQSPLVSPTPVRAALPVAVASDGAVVALASGGHAVVVAVDDAMVDVDDDSLVDVEALEESSSSLPQAAANTSDVVRTSPRILRTDRF